MVSGKQGLLLVVSGPAGSGKTTLCESLARKYNNVMRLVTATSRPPRTGEEDGVDYHFLSKKEFARQVECGDFLEWALVHDRYYGTRTKDVMKYLQEGRDLLLNIDVQGAASYRKAAETDPRIRKSLHTLFIKIPDLGVVRKRLENRGDSEEEIQRRIQTAEREIMEMDKFDSGFETRSREEDFRRMEEIYLRLKKSVATSSS